MTTQEIQQVVSETLKQLGLVKATISQAEAFRRYGRGKVERWVAEGWISPVSDGSGPKRYDIMQLYQVSKNNNALNKYLKTPTNGNNNPTI